MIGRFVRWWVTWAMVGALIAALTYLALFRLPSTPRSEAVIPAGLHLPAEPDRPQSGAPNDEAVPRTRGTEPATTRDPAHQAAVGAPISTVPVGLGNLRHQSAGSADRSPSARPLSCSSPCAVDVAEWDVPTPEPVDVALVAQNGIASHMGYGFPASYLALPIGRGYVARICGPAACVTRISTDAGPAKHMQRPPYNRVADLSVADFERVCGCSYLMGLVNVSVAIVGRAK